MTEAFPWTSDNDGVLLAVRLTPRGSGDEVGGIVNTADGRCHLSAKVRAVPEKGAANAALERLIAAWLEVPKGSVSIVAGAASRLKTVRVSGEPTRLAERIAERLRHSPRK